MQKEGAVAYSKILSLYWPGQITKNIRTFGVVAKNRTRTFITQVRSVIFCCNFLVDAIYSGRKLLAKFQRKTGDRNMNLVSLENLKPYKCRFLLQEDFQRAASIQLIDDIACGTSCQEETKIKNRRYKRYCLVCFGKLRGKAGGGGIPPASVISGRCIPALSSYHRVPLPPSLTATHSPCKLPFFSNIFSLSHTHTRLSLLLLTYLLSIHSLPFIQSISVLFIRIS